MLFSFNVAENHQPWQHFNKISLTEDCSTVNACTLLRLLLKYGDALYTVVPQDFALAGYVPLKLWYPVRIRLAPSHHGLISFNKPTPSSPQVGVRLSTFYHILLKPTLPGQQT